MPQITLKRLQQIIREELSLNEGADHDSAAKVMSSATKLLKAVESFKSASSEKARSEMGTHLDEIEKILNRVVGSPMQYVDATEPAMKKVTLKPAKDETTM
ncbi:MAG: hypothetical protein EBR82_00655 [Caulobacteraceae bacterium]|nr:hypothetical protein [Caulobacteraceae bacterium]